MAKRRRLDAPSEADLSRIEEEFRRETAGSPRRGGPPIAKIAGEAAAARDVVGPGARAEQAQMRADADRLRTAEAEGLILREIAIDRIDADAMIRDRAVLDEEALTELQMSIASSGLRLPIEVFEGPGDEGGPRYGLLSGYRRLRAVQNLRGLSGAGGYDTIRAIVRRPEGEADRFAAMVEENEIRAALSHYERGRIAVIATQQGAFESVEVAVAGLFPVASKAKRSKIRSFALIFEELGDLLSFPEMLREKDGLRLAAALRNGDEGPLREALATGQGVDPAGEWAVIEAALAEIDPPEIRPSRGGRPPKRPVEPGWKGDDTLVLSSGVTLQRSRDAQGFVIRISGAAVDAALIDSLMSEIQYLLERP